MKENKSGIYEKKTSVQTQVFDSENQNDSGIKYGLQQNRIKKSPTVSCNQRELSSRGEGGKTFDDESTSSQTIAHLKAKVVNMEENERNLANLLKEKEKEIMLMNTKLVQYKNFGKQRSSTLFQADNTLLNNVANINGNQVIPDIMSLEKSNKLRPMGLQALESRSKQSSKKEEEFGERIDILKTISKLKAIEVISKRDIIFDISFTFNSNEKKLEASEGQKKDLLNFTEEDCLIEIKGIFDGEFLRKICLKSKMNSVEIGEDVGVGEGFSIEVEANHVILPLYRVYSRDEKGVNYILAGMFAYDINKNLLKNLFQTSQSEKKLVNRLKKLNNINEDLNTKLSKREEENNLALKSLREKSEELASRNKALEQRLQAQEKDNQRVFQEHFQFLQTEKEKVNTAMSDKESLEKANKELRVQLDNSKVDMQRLQKEIKDFAKEREDLQKNVSKAEEKIKEILEAKSEGSKKAEMMNVYLKGEIDKKSQQLDESKKIFDDLQNRLVTLMTEFENYKKESDKKRQVLQESMVGEGKTWADKLKKAEASVINLQQKLAEKDEEIKEKQENLSVVKRVSQENQSEFKEKLRLADERLKLAEDKLKLTEESQKVSDTKYDDLKKYSEFQNVKIKKVEEENLEWRKINDEKNEIIQKFEDLSKRNQEERKLLQENFNQKETSSKKVQAKKPASKPSEIREEKAPSLPKVEEFGKISEKIYLQRIKELETELMQERLKHSKSNRAESDLTVVKDIFLRHDTLVSQFSDENVIRSHFAKGEKPQIKIKKIGLWLSDSLIFGLKFTYYSKDSNNLIIEGGNHVSKYNKEIQKYFEIDVEVHSIKCSYDKTGIIREILVGLDTENKTTKLLYHSDKGEVVNIETYKFDGEQYLSGELKFVSASDYTISRISILSFT